MTTRYFHVVYLADRQLQLAIDAIRLIADPTAKGRAHITLGGPFPVKEPIPVDGRAVAGHLVKADQVDNFFDSGQTTVFIRCSSHKLRDLWRKSDYGYNPHITIYNGESRSFATKLNQLLERLFTPFSFGISSVALLESVKGAPRKDLSDPLNLGTLSWVTGEHIQPGDLLRLTTTRRLQLIESVWSKTLAGWHPRDNLFARTASVSPIQQWVSTAESAVDVQHVVRDAYKRLPGNESIDRVIADPDLFSQFVRECWKLHLQADQCQLGRLLLNARKSGVIGPNPLVERYSVARHELDRYSMAVESAIRMVQDETWQLDQYFAGLDYILCHPLLSSRFHQLASQLAPGFEARDYRWAALYLRKSGRSQADERDLAGIHFDLLGKCGEVSERSVESEGGFVWLRSRNSSIYVGEAANLRTFVGAIQGHYYEALPMLSSDGPPSLRGATIGVSPSASLSASRRQYVKRMLLGMRKSLPRLNAMKRQGVA